MLVRFIVDEPSRWADGRWDTAGPRVGYLGSALALHAPPYVLDLALAKQLRIDTVQS